MDVRFMRLRPDAVAPRYAHAGDAGLDLCSCEAFTLAPGSYAVIPTGIAMALPPGTEGQVRPRSGLAARHGISVLNSPGTIDAGYRGEIGVILINHGTEAFTGTPGMKIAQLVIQHVLQINLQEGTTLDETARGQGGFGSTGV